MIVKNWFVIYKGVKEPLSHFVQVFVVKFHLEALSKTEDKVIKEQLMILEIRNQTIVHKITKQKRL